MHILCRENLLISGQIKFVMLLSTAISFLLQYLVYIKNFIWGPTVNKEIGINYAFITFCMLTILSNRFLLFNFFSNISFGVL